MDEEMFKSLRQVIQEEIQGSIGREVGKLKETLEQKLSEAVDNKVEEKVTEATLNLKTDVESLKTKNKQTEIKIDRCEHQIMDERKKRNIIVRGLGMFSHWKEREDGVFKLIRNHMGVRCEDQDIDYIINLDKSRNDGPILIRFTTLRKKLEVISKRRTLQGTKIFVDEDYSKEVVEQRIKMRPIMKQLKEQGKNVVMKKDKLFVDGKPWTQEEEEADVEMEVDSAGEGTSSNIQTKVPGKMKVVGQQRKRGRSPVQESREKTKKKVISGQSSLTKFITKHGMRERSHSLGSLGPEVAKIVDKLESSEESRGGNTQEKNQNVKEKKTQEENKKPDNTQTNKDENGKEGDTKEVED
ncbi:hypothetical protein M8J77_023969 [Diaphorina citri]|nr:hypothetical protein M8J77_023969 [Diaphorina citri]